MAELRYVEAGPGDIERLDALHGFTDPQRLRHEYWTYLPDLSVLFMVLDGERIVGTQAFIPYEMVINGRLILTGRSERTLVSPEYRGQGVFAKLVESCCRRGAEKGHRFFWGYSTSAIKALMRTGFLHLTGHREYFVAAVGATELAAYVASPDRGLSLQPREIVKAARARNMRAALEYFKLAAAPLSLASRLPALLLRRLGPSADLTLTREPLHEEDLDGLYERLRSRGELVVLKHRRAFHTWTLEGGGHDVRWLHAYRGGELTGYLCVSMKSASTAAILDFAAADRGTFRDLLEQARAEARGAGRTFLSTVCNPRNALQRALFPELWAAGFVRSFRRQGNSIIRPGAYNDMTILAEAAPWYMTDLWGLMYHDG